mgnify:CR=1 FL=1
MPCNSAWRETQERVQHTLDAGELDWCRKNRKANALLVLSSNRLVSFTGLAHNEVPRLIQIFFVRKTTFEHNGDFRALVCVHGGFAAGFYLEKRKLVNIFPDADGRGFQRRGQESPLQRLCGQELPDVRRDGAGKLTQHLVLAVNFSYFVLHTTQRLLL